MKPPATVWVRIFASGYKQVTTNKQKPQSYLEGYEDFEYELKENPQEWVSASLERERVNNAYQN